jgi:hypothetical protein
LRDRFLTHWRQFFFAREGPLNLAACRVLFYGIMLGCYGFLDFSQWGNVSEVFRPPPWKIPLLLWLPALSASKIQVLQWLWVGALIFSCVGLWTRWSTTLSFLLGFYLISLPVQFGDTSHTDLLPVLISGILMCSRCGAAWSMDAFFRRHRHSEEKAPPPSGEYTWPIRLVWVLFAMMYFAAGIAKLRWSGLDWVFRDSLSRHLLFAPDVFPAPWLQPEWSLAVGRQTWLCRLLAGTTLLLEIGYPLTLISWRLRWLFVPGALAGQVGILFLLGPNFLAIMLCNVFWVPWNRLLAQSHSPSLGSPPGDSEVKNHPGDS